MLTARRLALTVGRGRTFSTKVALTKEEIEKARVLQEKYKLYKRKSAYPDDEVPMFHADGSDLDIPENASEIAALTGMPAEQQARTVLIAPRPHRSSQTGFKYFHQWEITWKTKALWKNPLMGWTSSADPMSNVRLRFNTREHAVEFATKNGWKYEVTAEAHDIVVPLDAFQYKDNFLDPKVMLKLKKEGKKCQEFAVPGFGKSNFFMPLKYHGDGPVAQHGPSTASATA